MKFKISRSDFTEGDVASYGKREMVRKICNNNNQIGAQGGFALHYFSNIDQKHNQACFKVIAEEFEATHPGFKKLDKIAVNGCRGSMKRARRKFRAYRRMVDEGTMTYEDLWSSVNGIIAYFEKYNDHNRVLKLRRLFYSLFGFSCESITEFRIRDTVCNERT